jgi:nucleotide-binding universal stress UspA family protein
MKVLFATDGSRQSHAALEMLKRLKLSEGDEILIVTVVDMSVPLPNDIYSGAVIPNSAELEKFATQNGEEILTEAAEALHKEFDVVNVAIKTELLYGSPENRIVEAVRKNKSNLVVVGSHGYGTWERLILGSVSDSVLHHVPCSVLVVRCCENNG